MVIANTNGSCFSQDELYTEPVTEHQKRNVRPHYMGLAKGSQNSLYSTAAADSSLNTVYERFDSVLMNKNFLIVRLVCCIINYDTITLAWSGLALYFPDCLYCVHDKFAIL